MKIQREQLQLVLGESITYHSNFTSNEKKQLLDFVLDADKYQLMSMIMDGEIIPPPRTESERWYIEQRFINEQHYRKGIMSYLGAVSGGPVWTIYRLARAFMDKCSAKCGVFRPNLLQRQHCIARCKTEYYKKLIDGVRKVNCKGDQTCEDKKKAEIAKFTDKLAKFGTRELELRKKREEASFELA